MSKPIGAMLRFALGRVGGRPVRLDLLVYICCTVACAGGFRKARAACACMDATHRLGPPVGPTGGSVKSEIDRPA